ncbi:MAG TPA: DMT family transporter [Desulfatiglandales bacterium]|nr:DMT family transporter [Desulfatiglandales bacterium]
MHQQTRSYLFAGAAVLLWSTVASAFKLSLRHLEPLQLMFFAGIISAVVLFLILAVQNKIQLLLRYPKKQLPICLLSGLLNPCLYYYALFEAYDRLSAQDALSINYSWPVMLVILSIFILKQRVRILELTAICIAYFGVIIIATHGKVFILEFADPSGVGFALASTLIWATFWIINVKQKGDLTITLFLNFIFALPALCIITYIVCPVSNVSLKGLAGAAYIGLFEMGVTFVLWSAALRSSTTTAKVSSLAFAAPFLSLLIIHAVIGEQIKISTLLGLILIVGGIILQAVFNKNPKGRDTGAPF